MHENVLIHFNPNHDKFGRFSKTSESSPNKKQLHNKKAIATGLVAGGLLAGGLAAKWVIADKNLHKSFRLSDAELSPTPAMLKLREKKVSELRKNAVVYTGKRFVLGALAGYGGYVLTHDGIFEKRGENQNGND